MNTRIEVVQDILKRLNASQKDDIRNVQESQLGILRQNFLTLLQDRYNLQENTELLTDIGKDDPDDAAMVLIRDVWQALNTPPSSKPLPFEEWGILPKDSPHMQEAEQLCMNILEKSQLPVFMLLPAVLKMRSDKAGDDDLFMEHLRALSEEYD